MSVKGLIGAGSHSLR